MPRNRWVDLFADAARVLRRAPATRAPASRTPASRTPVPHMRTPGGYVGDYTGPVDGAYSPRLDGEPDPGEVVWTWVPYEDDHARGKDRPVLLVGRDGPWLLGLQLTSKDHDRDAAQEARYGRQWMDLGSGPWDARGRPSEVRLDRVVRVAPEAVRREGAVLDRALFERVVAAAARARG